MRSCTDPTRGRSPLSMSCLRTALMSLTLLLAAAGHAQTSMCGSLTSSYGPFDFRTDKDKLPIVTTAHFTPEVEALIRGTTSRLPGGDIAYTLRAIPNHHGALIAIVRLGEKEKTDKPHGSTFTVECWFDRAIRFRADDQLVRMIYADYLIKKQREADARAQLDVVKTLAADNAFTHHNLGLLLADLKDYDAALLHAHRAMALGLSHSALRDKLLAAGRWKDPAPADASSAASAASQ